MSQLLIRSGAFPKLPKLDEKIRGAEVLYNGFEIIEITCLVKGGLKCKIPIATVDKHCHITESDTLVIYCPGNTETVYSKNMYARMLNLRRTFNCPVVSFDYPRDNKLQDTRQVNDQTSWTESFIRQMYQMNDYMLIPDEEWLIMAATQVTNHLLKTHQNIKNLIVWGRSLGSVAAFRIVGMMARDYPGVFKGMVIESGLASALHAFAGGVFHSMVADGLDNLRVIRSYGRPWPCPVLVIHGSADEDISVDNADMICDELGPEVSTKIIKVGYKHEDMSIPFLEGDILNWYHTKILAPLLAKGMNITTNGGPRLLTELI